MDTVSHDQCPQSPQRPALLAQIGIYPEIRQDIMKIWIKTIKALSIIIVRQAKGTKSLWRTR